jgi:4-methyl-5(b-hydroxyethyl)-thiazole monophosphate biosynthesis
VVTASIGDLEVAGAHDIVLRADTTVEEVLGRTFDLVYLPGGMEGTERLSVDPRVGDLLRTQAEAGRTIAAICAAPIALRAHGLLPAGVRFTSHPGVRDELSGDGYVEDRVVIDGDLITSRGPGTAMELALALAERLAGEPIRTDLESAMLVAAPGDRA